MYLFSLYHSVISLAGSVVLVSVTMEKLQIRKKRKKALGRFQCCESLSVVQWYKAMSLNCCLKKCLYQVELFSPGQQVN